ncbi:hypothetical protein V8E36_001761 [Tilletia maclaganii]
MDHLSLHPFESSFLRIFFFAITVLRSSSPARLDEARRRIVVEASTRHLAVVAQLLAPTSMRMYARLPTANLQHPLPALLSAAPPPRPPRSPSCYIAVEQGRSTSLGWQHGTRIKMHAPVCAFSVANLQHSSPALVSAPASQPPPPSSCCVVREQAPSTPPRWQRWRKSDQDAEAERGPMIHWLASSIPDNHVAVQELAVIVSLLTKMSVHAVVDLMAHMTTNQAPAALWVDIRRMLLSQEKCDLWAHSHPAQRRRVTAGQQVLRWARPASSYQVCTKHAPAGHRTARYGDRSQPALIAW